MGTVRVRFLMMVVAFLWGSITSMRNSLPQRWCSPCCTLVGSLAVRATRCLEAYTASASRWSTLYPVGSRSRSTGMAAGTTWTSWTVGA